MLAVSSPVLAPPATNGLTPAGPLTFHASPELHCGNFSDRAEAPLRLALEERKTRAESNLGRVVELEELVRRCQGGEEVAFREVFRRHRSDVARLVQRLLGGKAEVEDVVQEVFLQVHRSIKDFRFGSRFSTWLYRVTVNVVLMHRRAARSRPILVDSRIGLVPHDATLSPEDQAARTRRVEAFYRLLERLSEKKRTAYVLHELEGLSPTEISKIVGTPVLTIRTRLFYARRELVQMLREEPSLSALAAEFEESVQVASHEPQIDSGPASAPAPHKEPA